MPEGPSIVILKEEAAKFKGKIITSVSGNSKIGIERLKGKKLTDIKSWGKHFLLCFKGFTVRIHLMLFGSYKIDSEKPGRIPRLSLIFKNGELHFYACSVKFIEGSLNEAYDWAVDVMSPHWNPQKALQHLKDLPQEMVCDVLLDQNIFAGSGNIVKNEVLFRILVHPENKLAALPAAKRKQLVQETHNYCFDFYKWKKKFELKKHWQVMRKKICPRCNGPVTLNVLGKTKRRTFFCTNCQVLYPKKVK